MRWSNLIIVMLAIALICVSIWAFALNRSADDLKRTSPARLYNHHLLQFTATDGNELERFRELAADVQLQFWSTQFVPNVPIVFQLRPENVSWFALQMDIFELPFLVLSSNLQKVFDPLYLHQNLERLTAELVSNGSSTLSPATTTDSAVHSPSPRPAPFDLNVYQPLERIVDYLKGLPNTTNGALYQLRTYGQSYEGRPLYLVRISEDIANESNDTTARPRYPNCPNKPAVFFECGIHAREWLSPSVCLQFIDKLLHNVEYTPWLKQFEFYFVPVFNPDGYRYSWTTDRMWRKNRRHITRDCFGVDLNRNFGVGFKRTVEHRSLKRQHRIKKRTVANSTTINDLHSSPDIHNQFSHNHEVVHDTSVACNRLNPGLTPFSEHETHAFHALLKSLQPRPTVYFSMHAYSQVWIYPYGYTDKPSAHATELDRMTRLAVEALEKRHGASWKAGGTIETLYSANGIAIDWVHQEVRVPYVFTVEMRDKGDFGFLLPEDQIQPATEEVWAGVEAILSYLKANLTSTTGFNSAEVPDC